MALIHAPLTPGQIEQLLRCLLKSMSIETPKSNAYIMLTNGEVVDSIDYNSGEETFNYEGLRTSNIETIVKNSLHAMTIDINYHILGDVVATYIPLTLSCYASNYIHVFQYTNTPPAVEIVNQEAITTSVNGTILGRVPIYTVVQVGGLPVCNETKLSVRHGIEGLWYIRKDGNPLAYQYWLQNKLVTKEEYDKYSLLCQEQVQKEEVLLPDLRQLVIAYMN